jgi:alpha-tubulin suppressor-like RCC1 family protein
VSENRVCAVINGDGYCWGRGWQGTIVIGSDLEDLPVTLSVAGGVEKIQSGTEHTCVLQSGAIHCYGYGGGGGALGGGTWIATMGMETPFLVGATDLAVQDYTTCAVVSGDLYCWGNNAEGAMGDGSFADANAPVLILSGGVTKVVGMGNDAMCAIQSGALKCFGENNSGKIGDGTIVNVGSPFTVFAAGVTDVSGGWATSCAVVFGDLQCWGDNSDGQYGDNSTVSSLTPVPTVSGVSDIALGWYHSCGIVSGNFSCWGNNGNKQLGIGSDTDPVLVPTLATGNYGTVTAISAADTTTCIVNSDGKIFCAGEENDADFGFGGWSQRTPASAF